MAGPFGNVFSQAGDSLALLSTKHFCTLPFFFSTPAQNFCTSAAHGPFLASAFLAFIAFPASGFPCAKVSPVNPKTNIAIRLINTTFFIYYPPWKFLQRFATSIPYLNCHGKSNFFFSQRVPHDPHNSGKTLPFCQTPDNDTHRLFCPRFLRCTSADTLPEWAIYPARQQ